MGEVNVYPQGLRQALVRRKFLAVVHRQGVPQLSGYRPGSGMPPSCPALLLPEEILFSGQQKWLYRRFFRRSFAPFPRRGFACFCLKCSFSKGSFAVSPYKQV
jgi:hypothetical protein